MGGLSSIHRTAQWALSGAAALLIMAVTTEPAAALCADPAEDGAWVNTDPNTRSISRIQLRFVCQDQIINGQLYPPGPPWYMRVFGRCHPNDCDWTEIGAQSLSSGHIHAIYNQGFATRFVWAKMSQYRPDQLWVYTWTDFSDPSRADYGSHDWFRQ